MALPRMRTAQGLVDLMREEDPNTAVTVWFVRSLIRSGRLPVTKCGAKKLINADKAIEMISSGDLLPAAQINNGEIRAIKE